jgi:hypothetical protein
MSASVSSQPQALAVSASYLATNWRADAGAGVGATVPESHSHSSSGEIRVRPPTISISEGLGIARGEELQTLERAYSIRANTISSLMTGTGGYINAPPTGTAAAAAVERQRAETLGGEGRAGGTSPVHRASSNARIVRARSVVADPASRPDPYANIKLAGVSGPVDPMRAKRPAAALPRPSSASSYRALMREIGYIIALTCLVWFAFTQLLRIFSGWVHSLRF